MDYWKPKPRVINPEEKTNFFLGFFFVYVRKLFATGIKKEFGEADIYEVLSSYKSQKLGNQLEKNWYKQLRLKNKPSLLLLLWSCFGNQYMLIAVSQIIPIMITYFDVKYSNDLLVYAFSRIYRPRIVKNFVAYFTTNHNNFTKSEAWFLGVSYVTVQFIGFIYIDNFYLRLETLGIKIRTALTSMIYRKVLNLSQLGDTSVGKIIALITRDVNEFDIYVCYLTFLWCESLRFLITCYVVYMEVGLLVLTLVGIFCFIISIQVVLAKILATLKVRTLKKTDERYQASKEMLDAITLIKCYLWGDTYRKKVSKIRKDEVCLTYQIYLLLVAKYTLSELVLNTACYIFIISLIWFGNQVKVETIFFLISTLAPLTISLKILIPRGMHELVKMMAVLKRIERFLISLNSQKHLERENKNNAPAEITLSNLDVYVGNRKIIENINLKIDGGLVALTGPMASGKSVLLHVIMREYQSVAGNLDINGNISFASQEPWLFPSTIKQNILFGAIYDEKRYLRVLQVCALLQDIQGIQGGDGYIVADRGINLSKGQQSRINLARAVYRDCDIYLLDDCLSNLDVFVGDYIFEKCIKEFLKEKLVILTTQNPKYISGADQTVIVNNEKLRQVSNKISFKDKRTDCTVVWKENKRVSETAHEEGFLETSTLIPRKPMEKNIYEEKLQSGNVKLKSFKKYIEHGGGLLMFITICIVFGVVQFSKSGMKMLENNWINTEQQIINCTNYNSTANENYKSAIEERVQMTYLFPVALGILSIMTFLKGAVYFLLAKKASLNFHSLLLENVTKASMEFFSNHYFGHVLNRFSEDLLYLDEKVPYSQYLALEAFAEIVGIIILMGTVNMTFLMASFAFCIFPLVTSIFCLKLGTALKRLEISTRCSLLGYVNATAEGLPTIRSANVEQIVIDEFDRHNDLYTSASYLHNCWFRALSFLIDIYYSLFTVVIILLFFINSHDISAVQVGFILSQSILFKKGLDVGYRRLTKLQTEMTAVERILEYTKQKLEPEGGVAVEGWPQQGRINFSHVYFSYGTSDTYVLHDLNFSIEPQQNIAIVGRTAGGKSSIISTILRLHKFEGKIFIDGVDITTLPLDTLRANIAVISQDPVLLTGTIRENIDLAGRYGDDEIWNAIKAVNLDELFLDLNHRISNVDVNVSLSQKQLLCMARAIVRKSKIIIMDEVTANVDQKTELMIHQIIREEFSCCTVIMITHKLDYIIEFDRVMVLDKGTVVEYDCPSVLLSDHDGTFYSMHKKYV